MRIGLLFTALLLGFSAAAAPQEELFTVRAQGYAEGIGFAARKAAIAEAQREVLRKVLNALVVRDGTAVLEPVYRNAARYIHSYDLLRHDEGEDYSSVEIDARVREQMLERDVAALMLPRLQPRPEVLFVVGERIGRDKIVAVPDYGVAETALREKLEEFELKGRGADSLDALYSQAELIAVVTGDVARGKRFALENPADVVVVGVARTTIEPNPAGTNVNRHRATLELRVFRGYDGKMTDELTAHAAVMAVDPMEGGAQAVRDAAAKVVGDVVVSAVITVLGTEAGASVLLTVENAGGQDCLDALTTAIRAFPPAGTVEELFVSPRRARLRIGYAGPMGAFADMLAAFTCGGRKLEVRRAVEREIVVRFK